MDFKHQGCSLIRKHSLHWSLLNEVKIRRQFGLPLSILFARRKKSFFRMKLHYLVILFEQIFSLSSDAEGLLKKIKIILDQICNPKFCQKCAKSLRIYHNFQHRGTCLTVLSERSCCNSWNLYTFWHV